MNAFSKFIVILVMPVLAGQAVQAQILKKIKDRASQTAENKILNKTEEATNKTMDGPGKKNKSQDDSNEDTEPDNQNADDPGQSQVPAGKVKESTLGSFANYDFVPGDKLIYYYDMAGERDAEIPGRMLVNDGNVEVQTYQGQKVLLIPKKANLSMVPAMKNNNYLPEQFTLEFDILANGDGGESSLVDLYFRKPEDAGRYWSGASKYYLRITGISGSQPGIDFTTHLEAGTSAGGYREFPDEAIKESIDNWRRVAIYVNKNIGKVYVDQHRVAIINRIEPGAGMVTFEFANETHPVMIKNIRIAAGGSDAYNKVMTDGKFIAYGIQFDVNKSILKPESMGTLNEIAKMMKENLDLDFEIGGHTDSDGKAELNEKLSQERAAAVKKQLVLMGIDENRLATKGYGSSKPIADNNSAENKARNRRVEFVKR